MLKDRGIDFLVSRFEGGGLLSQPTLRDLTGPFSVRATLQWMDLLLAALDCYNTFISLHIMKPHHMFSKSFTPGVDRYLPLLVKISFIVGWTQGNYIFFLPSRPRLRREVTLSESTTFLFD